MEGFYNQEEMLFINQLNFSDLHFSKKKFLYKVRYFDLKKKVLFKLNQVWLQLDGFKISTTNLEYKTMNNFLNEFIIYLRDVLKIPTLSISNKIVDGKTIDFSIILKNSTKIYKKVQLPDETGQPETCQYQKISYIDYTSHIDHEADIVISLDEITIDEDHQVDIKLVLIQAIIHENKESDNELCHEPGKDDHGKVERKNEE